MPFLVSPSDLKMIKTQRKLTLVLELIELKKENHLYSQLSELLKNKSPKTTHSIKNIFQLMVINFSTLVQDKFFSDGTILMSEAEEFAPPKPYQELAHLELLEISCLNSDLHQFTFHHQHGEIIMLFSQEQVFKLEHTDISIRKQRDLISTV